MIFQKLKLTLKITFMPAEHMTYTSSFHAGLTRKYNEYYTHLTHLNALLNYYYCYYIKYIRGSKAKYIEYVLPSLFRVFKHLTMDMIGIKGRAGHSNSVWIRVVCRGITLVLYSGETYLS